MPDEALEFGFVNRRRARRSSWTPSSPSGRRVWPPVRPLALSMTKTMLNNSFNISMDQALEEESRSQAVNFGTADTIEALRAFAEKREPRFEGR